MEINIYNNQNNVTAISGFTIVVDVFRAFSTSYYIAETNPLKYIISENIEKSKNLKKNISSSILIGERNGLKIPGFDFGNSPTEIIKQNFENKTIIHNTTAGTKGLLLQPETNEVIVGSFVNLNAIIKYIRINEIEKINIYCTALKKQTFGKEDYIFAEYLKKKLLHQKYDFEKIILELRKGSKNIFNSYAPYTDFLYCLDISKFDFILKRKILYQQNKMIELEKINF
jgi:2-phosphosulfolactate phosphatase